MKPPPGYLERMREAHESGLCGIAAEAWAVGAAWASLRSGASVLVRGGRLVTEWLFDEDPTGALEWLGLELAPR